MLSEPCLSVLAYLKLSQVEFQTSNVSLGKQEHLTEEFTKINPFQAVPAISHEGFYLNESAAIVTYVAESLNLDNQWYPKDLKIRARINAYFHWHHQGVRQKLEEHLMKKIFLPMFYGASHMTQEEEDEVRAKTLACVDDFEWILSDSGYAARTQTPTIADIFAFNEFNNLRNVGVSLKDGSRMKKWFDEISSLEVLQELQVHCVAFYNSLKPNGDN
jgi:glutathione S-transferase